MKKNLKGRPFSRRRLLAVTGGAALSLPWLESFTNRCEATGRDQESKPAKRLAFFYLPNGICLLYTSPSPRDS